MKRVAAIIACLCLGGCMTTTSTRIAATPSASRPPAGSRILVVDPDVQLSMLLASGLTEPKADWSSAAHANIDSELKADLGAKSLNLKELDPKAAQAGDVGQILRLHEAVGKSIIAYNYGAIKLPTKTGPFDWTLGEGAQALGRTYDADYALFTYARGSYSSSGRKVAMVGLALVGVSIPMGGQNVFASLVDLRTGRIVWFNMAHAGPQDDMRSPEHAKPLVASLLKDLPL